MYDARQVANFLLDLADEAARPLTNMALLKHIYFAHGWHLAQTGNPLVKNRFEAWEFGPVVRVVYYAFKACRARPILSRATAIDWDTGEEFKFEIPSDWMIQELIRSTFAYYSSYGALELSDLTHEPEGPWYEIWHRSDGRITMNMEIAETAIKAHFLRVSTKGRTH